MHDVVLTVRAEAELQEAHAWWSAHRSPAQADRWYTGFVRQLLTLETDPERHPYAPENEFFPYELRQLHYGLGRRPTHRAIFTVRPEKVVILRVRHLAQKPLAPEDF